MDVIGQSIHLGWELMLMLHELINQELFVDHIMSSSGLVSSLLRSGEVWWKYCAKDVFVFVTHTSLIVAAGPLLLR